MSNKIVCVVPTIRPTSMESFKKAWAPLFDKHKVTLITVWDGEVPVVEMNGVKIPHNDRNQSHADLFCRFTDGCRNLGFVLAASLNPDYVLTLDDDVEPLFRFGKEYAYHDPIQVHLDILQKKVPLSWMSTTHADSGYTRGFPYDIRDEAPVMLSHGVWRGVPDYDAETQLRLEESGILCQPLSYYIGPIPKGVLFPVCGMNVMIRKEALPHFYFAPMGPDSGVKGLHRFADIWMGIFLKRKFDELGWVCYTGGSVVYHTRASDAKKNMEQEKLVREWNEWLARFHIEPSNLGGYGTPEFWRYLDTYENKRKRYAQLISSLLGKVN